MNTRNIDREEIFHRAAEIEDPAKRAAYLEQICGDNKELHADIESLLEADHRVGDFLDAPILDTDDTFKDSPLTEVPGTVIDRYKILEKIGEGGMATVYMAEQTQPIHRRVALKVIKLGMDTKEVIARFEVERQALALMDHPNIAKVHDAGSTETGRPYFVMELVRGVSITEYCDKNNLSTQERLELFLSICHAVQHAHQKGIIHRDIKPTNVLVTMRDGKPVPKVIDFGIAKATNQRLTEKTLFTKYAQMIGTPEYMSPEQAEMSELDIDTRTDIYSLGVLLYELLTGVTPFDAKTLREAGYIQIQKIICEEEPTKPSTKLSGLGETLADVARHRKTSPDLLRKLVRGDLDWIVMKAMEKDRTRRYATAMDLVADIERNLSHETVLAAAPSLPYKLRKFIRRNRVAVIAGSLVAVALITGFSIALYGLVQAQKRRDQAETNYQQTEEQRSISENLRIQTTGLLGRSQVERGVKLLNEGNRQGLLDLLNARETVAEIPRLRESFSRLWAIAYDAWSDQLVHVIPGGRELAVSPKGNLIAVVNGSIVQLWQIDTGQSHGYPLDLGEEIASVLFSPDGNLLAATSKKGIAKLWNPFTGQQFGPILRKKKLTEKSFKYIRQRSTAFSSDGKLIAVAFFDGTVFIWKTDTGQMLREPFVHPEEVISLAFSPDGKWLATGSFDKKARLWTLATGEQNVLDLPRRGWVEKVVFSPDGKLLATASNNGATCLWDVTSGELHSQLTTHEKDHEWMQDLAFSPDSKLLAGASFYWKVKNWDTQTGEPYGLPLAHIGRATSVVFSPEGKILASTDLNGTLKLWEVETGKLYGPPLFHAGTVQFDATGQLLVTTGFGATRVWRIERKLKTTEVPYVKNPSNEKISSDGKVKVVISNQVAWFYDAASGETISTEIPVGHNILDFALSTDGMRLATCHDNWFVKVWDVITGEVKEIWCGDRAYGVAFNPNANILAIGLHRGIVRLLDMDSGQQLGADLHHPAPIWALAFSPDGTVLAAAYGIIEFGKQSSIQLWDVSTDPPYYGLKLPMIDTVEGRRALSTFSVDETIKIKLGDNETSHNWKLPSIPTDLQEMQKRTWVALSVRYKEEGVMEAVPWEQWQEMKKELQNVPE